MENLKLIKMTEIEAQEEQWLWHPYILFGKITIIQGDPGEGKTHFVLAIASALTNDVQILNSAHQEPLTVIYQTAEDGLADTIKPRLEMLHADCDKVIVIDESTQALSLSDKRIEQAINETGANLLILDPLQAYLGADVDMHRANEIRPIFHALGLVAEHTGCAIVMIGHMNKGSGKSGYRGLGSIDITAAARSVLVIGKSPQDPHIKVMAHSKSNLAHQGSSIAFEIGEKFRFIGECDVTVDELLNGFSRRDVLGEAKQLLSLLLSGTTQPSKLIAEKARALNISKRTLKKAKKELEIVSEKVGEQWFSRLP